MTLTLTTTGSDRGEVSLVLAGVASGECPEVSLRWISAHHHHPLRNLNLYLDVEHLTLPTGLPLPPCTLCLRPLAGEVS